MILPTKILIVVSTYKIDISLFFNSEQNKFIW